MNYTEEYLNSIDEAMQDEEFAAKLSEIESKEQLQALFAEKNIEIDDVVAQAAFDKVANYRATGELSEDDLEMVAGGKKGRRLLYSVLAAGVTVGCTIVGGPAGFVVGAALGCNIIYNGVKKDMNDR